MTLKIGLVGCGKIAGHHLKFITASPRAELVGLADVDINAAKRLGKQFGVENVHASVEELLQSAPIDVLHVTTPPQYHYAVAEAAIKHGVNVLVEKPMTLKAEGARKLYDLAVKNNVSICVDFIQLFNPSLQAAARLIDGGALGRVLSVQCELGIDITEPEFREPIQSNWKYDLPGGIFHDFLPHPLYLTLRWLGKLTSVHVAPRSFGALPQGLTDHLDIFLEGESVSAHALVSLAAQRHPYRLRVTCELGAVTVDFNASTVMVESQSNLPRLVDRGWQSVAMSYQMLSSTGGSAFRYLTGKLQVYQGLKVLIEEYYRTLQEGLEAPVSGELVMAVAEAEEKVIAQAGKLHLHSDPIPSSQQEVTRPERVLVTGASGYVGRELVGTLVKQGYSVRAFVRAISQTDHLKSLGVEVVYGDVRDQESLSRAAEGMDVIVHLAAALTGTPGFVYETCVAGTEAVAKAASEQRVKRVIYMSSVSVYDFLALGSKALVDEESPIEAHPELRGAASYAKAVAEQTAIGRLHEASPAWTILRPSLIVGNGRADLGLVGQPVGPFLVVFGGPSKALPFVHVTDVCTAIIQAFEAEDTKGRIFNVSDNQRLTVGNYMTTWKAATGGSILPLYIPRWFSALGFGLLAILKKLTGKGPRVGRRRLAYMYQHAQFDHQSLSEATGWQPAESPMADIAKHLHG
jgi:predicted dehydrogenase/nucleoside-diphosphate-sugar epimerase